MELYLPFLNVVMVVLLAVAGVLLGRVGGEKEGMWMGFAYLPAGIYAVVLGVKVEMGRVDPRELEGLRYGYKGA